MKISIIDDAAGWRRALAKFGRHESYHTWDFHRIDTRENDAFFALEVASADSTLFFPVVSRQIRQSGWRDLTSVYGYPGPIHAGKPDDFPATLEAAFSRFGEMGYVSLFSRCSAFAMQEMPRPDCYCQSGKVAAIDLRLPADEQWRQYRDNLRREITRAMEGGLTCTQGGRAEVAAFIDLYHQTMNRVAANSHYYFDENYVVRMLESSDFDCRLYVCKYDNHIIAAALFIFLNGVVQYHLSGSDAAYAKSGATKLLIDTVRRVASAEGFTVMNLGGGLGGLADHLYNFKRGFTRNETDFFLIKKVLNPGVYRELLSPQHQHDAGTTAFFPAYRNIPVMLDAANGTA